MLTISRCIIINAHPHKLIRTYYILPCNYAQQHTYQDGHTRHWPQPRHHTTWKPTPTPPGTDQSRDTCGPTPYPGARSNDCNCNKVKWPAEIRHIRNHLNINLNTSIIYIKAKGNQPCIQYTRIYSLYVR